jgi:hypothetical protein
VSWWFKLQSNEGGFNRHAPRRVGILAPNMERRTPRRSEPNAGAPEHWGLDPQDVRRHARRMREATTVSPLGRFFRFAAAAALAAVAVAVYWNFDDLRDLRFDFSRVTGAFEDAVDEVEDARRGGELETEAIEDTSIAGVRMETSLDGETPPEEAAAPEQAAAPASPPAEAPPAEAQVAVAPPPAAQPADPLSPGANAADVAAPPAAAPPEQPAPPAAAPAPAPTRSATAAREEPRPVARPEPEGPITPETFGFGLEVMTVSEADASARVLVLRDGGRRGVSLIRWWTTNGTAIAGSDFARLEPRTERFALGEQNRTLLIPIIGDRNVEGPENFFVHIALDEGSDPKPIAQIEVIINDDD